MKLGTSSALKAAALTVCVVCLACCAAAQLPSKTHGAHSGDLVSALEFISTTFHLPIIAELTKSYPAHVSLLAGEDTAEHLLSQMSGQSRGYAWVTQDGVVLFYDIRLREAPGNFFNATIPRFVMPPDVAELALQLNQEMGADAGKARVMAGVPEKALASVKLRNGEVLSNVTGREVLVEAAKQSNNLFSVVLFPTANPRTAEHISQAHMNWYLRSIDELRQNPTRLRSIPGGP